jgi:hypothetical protein
MPDTTSLNRPWLAKMLIFFAVALGLGLWGLYDAMINYPQRGLRHASYLQYQYLDAANAAHLLDRKSVSVPDPVAELQRLDTLEPTRATPLDPLRRDWLHALRVVGALDAAHTAIDDPDARYKQLKAEWITGTGAKSAPKPLSNYDIIVQWLIAAAGLGVALWILGLFLAVARHRYTWDEATQTLTLPGGHTLTPRDIGDFDKRKWDKFLIFLKINPTHATLGGREIKLDLYRYTPLESWVLAMERTAFPERTTDTAVEPSPPEAPAA